LPYFHIPLTELSTHTLLAEALQKISGVNFGHMVVVSPDKGGKSRSERFAKAVGLPILYMDKVRDVATGEVTVTNVSGDVTGKPVIIFDDIINTGATAVKTSEFLKTKGVSDVYFLATHAVLAGEAVSYLSGSPITKVVVTDSILIAPDKHFPKLTVASISPLLASAIAQYVR
jgi:ribose-phosphate pyrophosphokinase